jgi:hypothetical protein
MSRIHLICPSCGFLNTDAEIYCGECGAMVGSGIQVEFDDDAEFGDDVNFGEEPPQQEEADSIFDPIKMRGRQFTLFADRVEIKTVDGFGAFRTGFSGDRRIPIDSIISVNFRAGGDFLNGYIQFETIGGQGMRVGFSSTTHDPNTFHFFKKDNPQMEDVRDFINQKIDDRNKRTTSVPNASSLSSELQDIIKLKERGLLTDEEFTAAKKKLLGL